MCILLKFSNVFISLIFFFFWNIETFFFFVFVLFHFILQFNFRMQIFALVSLVTQLKDNFVINSVGFVPVCVSWKVKRGRRLVSKITLLKEEKMYEMRNPFHSPPTVVISTLTYWQNSCSIALKSHTFPRKINARNTKTKWNWSFSLLVAVVDRKAESEKYETVSVWTRVSRMWFFFCCYSHSLEVLAAADSLLCIRRHHRLFMSSREQANKKRASSRRHSAEKQQRRGKKKLFEMIVCVVLAKCASLVVASRFLPSPNAHWHQANRNKIESRLAHNTRLERAMICLRVQKHLFSRLETLSEVEVTKICLVRSVTNKK